MRNDDVRVGFVAVKWTESCEKRRLFLNFHPKFFKFGILVKGKITSVLRKLKKSYRSPRVSYFQPNTHSSVSMFNLVMLFYITVFVFWKNSL